MGMREQIGALMMDDDDRVRGKPMAPVDFHPINKTANRLRVDRLDDAVKRINVAMQTVGFYPSERMPAYCNSLAAAGAQRIVHLGEADPSTIGNPHDAVYSLHRFVRWMAHEYGARLSAVRRSFDQSIL
jgi:hypothetical protein